MHIPQRRYLLKLSAARELRSRPSPVHAAQTRKSSQPQVGMHKVHLCVAAR